MSFCFLQNFQKAAVCLSVLLLLCFASSAQTPDAGQGGLSVSGIQEQLNAVPTLEGLDDATRQELTQAYNETLDQLRATEEWTARAAKFEQWLQDDPAEVQRLRDALEASSSSGSPEVPDGASVAQVEGFLVRAEGELNEAKATRATLEEETLQRGERRRQLPELLAGARRRLSDISAERVTAASAPAPLVEAKRGLADARSNAVQSEIDAYEKELQSYDMHGRLLTLQLDQAIRDAAIRERQVQAWSEAVHVRRQQEAVAAVEAAGKALAEAEGASPRIRQVAQQLAQQNVALVTLGTSPEGLAGKAQKTAEELEHIQEQLGRISSDFTRVSKKVEAVRLNNSMGLLLLKQREALPNLAQHRRNLRARQEEISDVQMQQIELQDQRLTLADIDGRLSTYLYGERHAGDKKPLGKVEQILRKLLEMQRDTLDSLLRDYDAHFEHLVDLDSAERALIDQTRLFSNYIDERVLWIRSGVMLNPSQMAVAWNSLQQLVSWPHWAEVVRSLWHELALKFHAGLLLLGCLFLFLWLRPKVTAELGDISTQAEMTTCTSLKPTLDSVAATFLLALPVPALVWFLGYRLAGSANAEAFARAFGTGLKDAAVVLMPLEFTRQCLRANGLFRGHFGWPSGPVATVRRHLPWLMAITGATTFLLALLSWQGEEHGRESLGRLAFMVNLVAISVFAHLLFHPRKGAVSRLHQLLFSTRRRSQLIWYLAWTITPVFFAVLAFFGYFYTTYRLSARLYETAILLFGLVLLRAVILRWFFLAKRRLMMKRAETAVSNQETEQGEPVKNDMDLAKVNAQTLRLIITLTVVAFLAGTWFIWTEELPALRILNGVMVWRSLDVTLADLMTGLAIAALTFVATANVPGLLELTVLQRMHYMKGERYAITTIVRYAIGIVGFSAAFNNFGIGWSRIQWLVAALGVGLGFGLQEIFANFISGLIILFERPIRVGDIVTVGGISGTVTRIRTRATLIVDFDRKELIVPNKEFITSQVINWTLTDSVLRLTVQVGVAYGSKTEQVEQILYEVARANSNVLVDPAPAVVFSGLGENALDFDLRVFCDNADCMPALRHSLHMAIERRFREAGIDIACPQREVHIRTLKEVVPATTKETKAPN